MSFTTKIERILTNLGENNSPTVIAMGIAIAKGIFRPIFTMFDKYEKLETKRYTAVREGLTELIAIPAYYFTGLTTKFLSKKLANPKFFMDKDTLKQFNVAQLTPQVQKRVAFAQKLAKENLPKITTSLGFIGVCFAALFLIPALCSTTIKPIMKELKLENPKDKVDNRYSNLYTPNIQFTNNSVFKAFSSAKYSGMRVGGL